MSEEAIEVNSGSSTTKIVIMIVGGIVLLAGIGFIVYILFNNPVANTLAGLFNGFTSFAKGVESAFKDCLTGDGNWNANCLWMYLGALAMLLPYAFCKIGSQTTAGSSDVVKKASFETGKTNDEIATEVQSYMEENMDEMRSDLEGKGVTGADQDYVVESAAAKMVEQYGIENANQGRERADVEKNMAEGLEMTRLDKATKAGISDTAREGLDDEADKLYEDYPPIEG